VFYTSIASINTPDYVEIHLYRRPTGRPSFTSRLLVIQPESFVGRCCKTRKLTVTVQRSLLAIHVGMSVAGRCFGVKLLKSRNYLRYFGSFNLFAVIKDTLYFVE